MIFPWLFRVFFKLNDFSMHGTFLVIFHDFQSLWEPWYDIVTEAWVAETMGSLNKGKSPDIYGMTTGHLVLASNAMMPVLTSWMNTIFSLCDLPDSLKVGLLTPIFKKKGSSLNSKIYREIIILSKLLESILLKNRALCWEDPEGFTKHSLMNCSLIVEEYIYIYCP